MTVAFVGLGANLDDPRRQLRSAMDELAHLAHTRVTARSSQYRSAPLGHAEQPDFINAVARLDTALEPQALWEGLRQIESAHGRVRSFRNAPRTLDLDLLLYGDLRVASPALTIPHPRMHERAFVLRPLLEIDPAARIPGLGEAREFLGRCAGQSVERLPE